MKKLTIIQARMSSTRLPGKVLLPILGKPLLERMLERVMASKSCGQVVVATSTNPKDQPIIDLCNSLNVDTFQGDEKDLLDRHYQCALKYDASIIAKIPSDCPLIDTQVIDKVFDFFDGQSFDYLSNLHPATYPDGNDVEIFTLNALKKAHTEATLPLEREHTTPYFWEHPELFSIGNVLWETGLDYSMSHRFTIDYQEDYLFIKKVYEELYPTHPLFTLDDILQLLEARPDIYQINANYAGVNWYRNHLDELKSIDASQTKNIDEIS